ncbi:DUF3298 and DUF4163 domain-containing protein [Mesonia aquimarina]|uniref:DUF3298 and DUF4163 domain-containing protein n=1 Tax=Mesonia aquimarina TaxID=1504967 RepID=UPI000EF5D725|nr:DUF3298 and DUF4163 domain-containing protein [Mesonia aquimarina]
MKKIALLFCLCFAFTGCLDDPKKQPATEEKNNNQPKEELAFTTVALNSKTIEGCAEKECPRVQVSYLKAENRPTISENINRINEKNLIGIFSAPEEKKPDPENLEKAIEHFITDYFSFKEEFPESPADYEAEISQEMLYQNDSLFVIKTNFYLFTGGAHGYGATRFQHFSTTTGNDLTQADLLSDKTAFTAYAEKKFREKFNIPSGETINSTGFFFDDNTFTLPENMAVTNDSIQLVYNRYEAASYAEGELKLSLPKSEVQQWINY